MMERERLVSAYVGNHVEFLLGLQTVKKIFCIRGYPFFRFRKGVDFGSEKVCLLFEIAGKDGTHIDLLSRIALACMDEENIDRLGRAKDKKVILDILG